ncbi:MAG: sulfite exporter TauE/SafE family protein [Pseudomonadota bacterium]
MSFAGLGPDVLLIAFAVFLLAGLIKGLIGIGLPTASVGMMSQVIDPRVAIALMVFPSLISNAWQVWRMGDLFGAIGRYRVFLGTLCSLILLLSIFVTGVVPTETLMLVLGLVICLFSIMSLTFRPPHIPARHDRLGQVLSGTAAGTLGGLTGIWAPPMVTYLVGRATPKDEFVRATGVMILIGTIPMIAGFWVNGMLTGSLALVSVAMTIPALAGFQVGEVVRRRLDADRFRNAVLIIFGIMGLNLLRRALV